MSVNIYVLYPVLIQKDHLVLWFLILLLQQPFCQIFQGLIFQFNLFNISSLQFLRPLLFCIKCINIHIKQRIKNEMRTLTNLRPYKRYL